jgi:hypothetical protein
VSTRLGPQIAEVLVVSPITGRSVAESSINSDKIAFIVVARKHSIRSKPVPIRNKSQYIDWAPVIIWKDYQFFNLGELAVNSNI